MDCRARKRERKLKIGEFIIWNIWVNHQLKKHLQEVGLRELDLQKNKGVL